MSLFGNKNQNSQTAVPAVPNQKNQKKQGLPLQMAIPYQL